MAVTAMQRPDFRMVSEFRRRHLSALEGLFKQVLRLRQRVGMVKLGHVARDGTKVKANANKRKAMSYERMLKSEVQLEPKYLRELVKRRVRGYLAPARTKHGDAERSKKNALPQSTLRAVSARGKRALSVVVAQPRLAEGDSGGGS